MTQLQTKTTTKVKHQHTQGSKHMAVEHEATKQTMLTAVPAI